MNLVIANNKNVRQIMTQQINVTWPEKTGLIYML